MKNTVRALMVVAHPDDCVIFGWPFVKRYSNFDWKILYLTYDEEQPRGIEIKKFWRDEGIHVDFCGVYDDHIDLDSGKIVSFDKDTVEECLLTKSKGYDILLTHGHDGEYGHPHHIFVNRVLEKSIIPKIYFSKGDKANIHIDGRMFGEYELSRLPLHRGVISTFEYRYDGFYLCDQHIKDLLTFNINKD